MFRSTGVFRDLMCPITNCDRANCVFWHDTVPSGSVGNQNDGSVNSASFSGYNAYVAPEYAAGSSSYSVDTGAGYSGYVAPSSMEQPSYNFMSSSLSSYHPDMMAPDSMADYQPTAPSYVPTPLTVPSTSSVVTDVPAYTPTPVVEAPRINMAKVKREVRNDEDDIIIVNEKIVNNEKKPPSPKPKNVAEIDAEIQRLLKLREQVKVEDAPPAPVSPPAPPVVKKKPVTVIGYTPTPIDDLRRRKEEERQKRKEKEERKKKEEEEMQRKEEEDKEKARKRKAKRENLVQDLFGDDSDDDVPKVKRSKISSASKSASKEIEVIDLVSKTKVPKRPELPVAKKISTPAPPAPPKPKESKNGELTADQIQLAKSRTAKPGALNIVRPAPRTGRVASAAEQLQARMQAVAKKRAETAPTTAPKKPMTLEQKFGMAKPAGRVSGSIKPGSSASFSKQAEKPQLLEPTNRKIALLVRMPYLNRIYQQLLEFLSPEEALEQAPLEEKAILDKVHHKQSYLVAAVNALKRIRDAGEGNKSSQKNGVSHTRLLFGSKYGQVTLNANGPKKKLPVTEERVYAAFEEHYLLDEEQMLFNSYPGFVDEKTVYIEPGPYDKKKNKKTFVPDHEMERLCVRCTTEYRLSPKGVMIPANCIFHLKGKSRVPGKRRNNEAVFPCCGGDDTVAGCQVADAHVSDTLRYSDLETFKAAPEPAGEDDERSGKIIALDCEMIYTVWGPALARLTVVDLSENILLDEIVRPPHEIIDYNTTFSGITASQIESATHTLEMVRDRLFELMNTKSILVGHSLDSDLKALRVVHRRIVDTAVLFPHRTEPDKKRGLKDLAMDQLHKAIQDDLGGHDSKEDAVTALQLAVHKAKFDGKL